jgi:arsenate reductase-like glutaredoxin family protein
MKGKVYGIIICSTPLNKQWFMENQIDFKLENWQKEEPWINLMRKLKKKLLSDKGKPVVRLNCIHDEKHITVISLRAHLNKNQAMSMPRNNYS